MIDNVVVQNLAKADTKVRLWKRMNKFGSSEKDRLEWSLKSCENLMERYYQISQLSACLNSFILRR